MLAGHDNELACSACANPGFAYAGSGTSPPSRSRLRVAEKRRVHAGLVARPTLPEPVQPLSGLPSDLWDSAELVEPVRKQAISVRVDEDVMVILGLDTCA
jgi:hypothetical protein